MTDEEEDVTPNIAIDRAIKSLMKPSKMRDYPTETAIKVIAQAISWEKAKHAIKEKESEFNPDSL